MAMGGPSRESLRAPQGGRMNRALGPRDRGDRGHAARTPSRRGGFVPVALGLVLGTPHPPRRATPPSLIPAVRKGRNGGESDFDGVGALTVLALRRDHVQA